MGPCFITLANPVSSRKASASVFSSAKWRQENTALAFTRCTKSPPCPSRVPCCYKPLLSLSPGRRLSSHGALFFLSPQKRSHGQEGGEGFALLGCHIQQTPHVKKRGKVTRTAPAPQPQDCRIRKTLPLLKDHMGTETDGGRAKEALRRVPTHLCPPRWDGGAGKEVEEEQAGAWRDGGQVEPPTENWMRF